MKHYIKSNFYEDAFEFEPDYTDTIDYHKIRLAHLLGHLNPLF